jgi:Lrp/AsnC family transcriptional regulator, leucine-responsive regulatory protein
MTPLDPFDLKILTQLQADATVAAARIGEAIGLSAAAVQRRIKRLRDNGTIAAITAQIDPAAAGFGVTCIVTVDLERDGAVHLDAFKRRMGTMPQVQQCYYVTGPTDCVLIVVCRDLPAYEAFTREAFLSDANVKSFTTHVVLERMKAGQALDL